MISMLFFSFSWKHSLFLWFVSIWGQKPGWPWRNPTGGSKISKNCQGYKRLGNTFWVSFFHFWYYQSDNLDLYAKIRWYIKKSQIHLFERIWQVFHILLKKSSMLPNMTKPSLKPCIVDPVDGFQCLSWCNIVPRSHFGFVEKKFHFHFFMPFSLRNTLKCFLNSLFLKNLNFFSTFGWD